MKIELYIKTLAISAVIFFLGIDGFSQKWGGDKRMKIRDNWSVNFNVGQTSYFGDLSLYDKDPIGKFSKESGLGFGMQITKHLSSSFGLSGQLLFGNIKGNKQELSFKTKLMEYSLQGRVNLVNLLSYTKDHKFNLIAFAGFGQFLFDARLWEYDGDGGGGYDEIANVPEFVIYAGGGICYKISENIGATGNMAVRQSQNDKLENYQKSHDYDYYTYISVGITYFVKTLGKKHNWRKATVAQRNSRRKPLRF